MDVDLRRRLIRAWLSSRSPRPAPNSFRRSDGLQELRRDDFPDTRFRRRRLPHLELAGATYFVTFRVARGRGRPLAFDSARWQRGNFELSRVALLVEETILFGFGTQYEVDAYVVMPDHVHLLVTPIEPWTLPRIMHGIKGTSAHAVNRALARRGPLWQDESFDHVIRSETDWLDKRDYIHENPVAAGLSATAVGYPLSSAVTLDPAGRREALRRLLAQRADGGSSRPRASLSSSHEEPCRHAPARRRSPLSRDRARP
ncbi:MAG: transposase [Chloroflexi bacterium]|nr:transposase [Chloroflexota bacterium]